MVCLYSKKNTKLEWKPILKQNSPLHVHFFEIKKKTRRKNRVLNKKNKFFQFNLKNDDKTG